MRRLIIAAVFVSACGAPITPTPSGAITETMTGTISGGDRTTCLYYGFPESPCASFARTFTSDGRVDAVLTWAADDATLLLQLWDVTAARVAATGRFSRDGRMASMTLQSTVSIGPYEFRVITAGAPSVITSFTITAQHPR